MRASTPVAFPAVLILVFSSGCFLVPFPKGPVVCASGGAFTTSTPHKTSRTGSALTVSGTVTASDGTPLRGQSLLLEKNPTAGDWYSLLFIAPLVVADCLTTRTSALCGATSKTVADASGAFGFTVQGEAPDGEHSFGLFASLDRRGSQLAGGSVSRFLEPTGQNLEVGETRLWDPLLTVSRKGSQLDLTVDGDRCPEFEDVELITETGESWLTVPAFEVEPELLDDAPLGLRLVAEVGLDRYRTAAVPLSGAGAPPSRGAACTLHHTDGSTTRESPCRLTDGQAGQTLDPDVDRVQLEVPAAQTNHVAVRGYGTLSARVEASTDGQSWFDEGRPLTESSLLKPGGTTRELARFVRLTASENGYPLGRIFEVLVW